MTSLITVRIMMMIIISLNNTNIKKNGNDNQDNNNRKIISTVDSRLGCPALLMVVNTIWASSITLLSTVYISDTIS
jgi:hypothetical protein